MAKEKSGRGRRRSREKGYQGVEDFRFITFIIFSFFFSILYFIIFFYTLFTHFVYPHPRPTTFSYTRSRLTDLISKKTNLHMQHAFLSFPCRCFARLQRCFVRLKRQTS